MRADYKKLYNEAEKLFKKSYFFGYGTYDETFCTVIVFETAKQIMNKLKKQKINREAVLISCIFHDIGKSKLDSRFLTGRNKDGYADIEWNKHSKLGALVAERILKKHGFSKKFIENVCFLIENHDNKILKEKSIELKILQDADIVADSGMVEVIRSFSYSGQFKRPLFEGIKRMKKYGISRYSPKKLNLKESRTIVKRKNELLKLLIKKSTELMKSELIN